MLIKNKLSVNNDTSQFLKLDLFEIHRVDIYSERGAAHLVR